MRVGDYKVGVQLRDARYVGVAVFYDSDGDAVMVQESVQFASEGVALVKITEMAKALHAVLSTGRRGA